MEGAVLLCGKVDRVRSPCTWEQDNDAVIYTATHSIQDIMKEITIVVKHVLQNVEARRKSTELDEEDQKEEERRKKLLIAGIYMNE